MPRALALVALVHPMEADDIRVPRPIVLDGLYTKGDCFGDIRIAQ